jgi:hypothetical protein
MAETNSSTYIRISSLFIAAILLIVAVVSIRNAGSGTISNMNLINNSNASASCPYGYKCGIKADGCALMGAVYNCPNEPVNLQSNSTPNETVTVNTVAQELEESAGAGFILNSSAFQANSQAECSRILISPCDNNEPSQFICVNQQYAEAVSSQYKSIYTKQTACPEFLMAGTVSCGLIDDYCVVVQQADFPSTPN